MSELKQGLQPDNIGGSTPQPADVKEISKEVVGDVEIGSPTYRAMVSDTIDGYVNNILEASKLTKTEENVNKTLMNVTKKVEQWLALGDFALEDMDEKEFTKDFFENATRRRGMDNKTDNWKKIIKLLLENN